MCTEKSLKDYNEWDRITTSLQHMASPKRRTMGMMVSFQRVWRWERSAHPGLAFCSSSSTPRVELLFGMSWILAPVLEHRLSAGVSKDQGDFTTILHFNFLFFLMTSNGLPSQFETKSFLCFFSCWLGLKSWICPSCCHPQFLPPTPVPEKAVSGQSQKSSTAAARIPLPVLSLLLLPSACWLSTHYLYRFPHVAFVFGSNSFFFPSQKGVIRRQTKWRSSM